MRKKASLLLVVILWLEGLQLVSALELQANPCSEPPDSLHTLDSVLQSPLENEQTYTLLPGEHCVRQFSIVRDVPGISFLGQGSVSVSCSNGIGLAFYNVSHLSFSNISISGCGMGPVQVGQFLSVVKEYLDFFLELSDNEDQQIAMAVAECSDFGMEHSIIEDTFGLGLLAINLIGSSHINNVTFSRNVPRGCYRFPNYSISEDKIGGGAFVVYHDYKRARQTRTPSSLEITGSNFLENSYCGSAVYYLNMYRLFEQHGRDTPLLIGGGGGLSIFLTQLQYAVNVSVDESVFRNNTALYGSGLQLAVFTGVANSLILFSDCQFESNGASKMGVYTLTNPTIGSAIAVFKDLIQPSFSVHYIAIDYNPTNITVRRSYFTSNIATSGTIIVVSLYNLILVEYAMASVILDGCIFENNTAIFGAVIFALEQKNNYQQLGIHFVLKDLQVRQNVVTISSFLESSSSANTGVIHLKNINATLLGTNVFEHNTGTALYADASSVYLSDDVTVSNNSGVYGGGFHLESSAVLVLVDNATLAFYNNSATIAGGALFVSQGNAASSTQSYFNCFLYFGLVDLLPCATFGCTDVIESGVSLVFEGNKAPFGGMIYGSTLEGCPWNPPFRMKYAPNSTQQSLLDILYDAIGFTSPFKFDSAPNSTTFVSTPVIRVSVLDPIENLNLATSILPLAPGIKRQINLTAYDAFNQLVPTLVSSRVSAANGETAVAGETVLVGENNFELLDVDTDTLTTLVVSGNQTTPGKLVPVSFYTVNTFAQFQLTVNITECPSGFVLSADSNNNTNCTCNTLLSHFSVSCNEDGRLLVPLNRWVGLYNQELATTICSFDFCSGNVTVVDMTKSYNTEQCNYDRVGVGCGRCPANLSHVFGSNRCRKCPNSYLSMLLLFGALGILLMLAILFLRVDISGGFLNGVLLFSNIVSVYVPFFAPNYTLNSFFAIFSWLSLKVGFDLCFYDGMKPVDIATFNFVFPLYLYSLMFGIILMAKLSGRVAGWLARIHTSPAKLFATILVMTYSSLLESCIQVLSFSSVDTIGNMKVTSFTTWRHDPSQRYFHGGHAALAMLSIFLLVFLLIPAPFVGMFPVRMLSSGILRQYTPIYDAMWAPLKHKYLYWVSLRLLFRVPPLIFVSVASSTLNLFFLTVYMAVLLFIHGEVQPFKRPVKNRLDGFLQLILVVTAVVALFFTLQRQQVGRLSDLNDVERINNDLETLESSLVIVMLLLVTLMYLTLVIIIFFHLAENFPKFNKQMKRMWNVIVICKKFHYKGTKQQDTTTTEACDDYRPINSYEENSTPPQTADTIKKVTFTELRESLLADTTDYYTTEVAPPT